MRSAVYFFLLMAGLGVFSSCNGNRAAPNTEPVVVNTPEDMDAAVGKNLKLVLNYAMENHGSINDSSSLKYPEIISAFYNSNDFKSIWSSREAIGPLADSLLRFINHSKYYGLYPEQYHQQQLSNLFTTLQNDSVSIRDVRNWTHLELFSTDAFFHLLRDLKEGRIVPDSLSIAHQQKFIDSFFLPKLQELKAGQSLTEILDSVEPKFFKYVELRKALPEFVDKMDPEQYPQIVYPFTDSLEFVKEVYARLSAGQSSDSANYLPDSATFRRTVRKFQAEKKLEVDGKPGAATIKELNFTDAQKFRSIAISLDRYKLLPKMPETFIWVNIPSFYLQVINNDTITLESKIIVGKPATPTPVLTSAINNLVVYPNWTIPVSIIKKEILPALKKDPEYLTKKGYNLYDEKGEIINPYGINWARYSTGIPWKVVQGSGDDNALGVFKFNFNNPYSVYLHDTNQRYLFANSNRALSHGCVRVQKWQQLADIIAERDSSMAYPSRLSYTNDSLVNWVANGVRKSVTVRNRFPLFIVYYTCESKDGEEIKFYSDLYNEDADIYEEYFMKKSL